MRPRLVERHTAMRGSWTVWLALATACGAGNTERDPLPSAARATCTAGIYGGGSTTEIRSDGEIRLSTFGPDRPTTDSLVGRDSVGVAQLLDRLSRLPWSTLRGDSGLYDVQCAMQVSWADTTRTVAWFPPTGESRYPEVVRLHEDIRALASPSR